jgi:hypothetical protein
VARGNGPPPVASPIAASIGAGARYVRGKRLAVRAAGESGSEGSASGENKPSLPSPQGLPSLPGIRFEKHKKGGFEAWKVNAGTRRGKSYVCYVGRKRLQEGPEAIAAFIAGRLASKALF